MKILKKKLPYIAQIELTQEEVEALCSYFGSRLGQVEAMLRGDLVFAFYKELCELKND